MAHFPSSRLSRQELYSYGFREGQPWGEDRRALESALREIDQLEREIQENYIYGRPALNNPHASSSATPRYMSVAPGGYFSPGRYPSPDVRMARSDSSDRASVSSSISAYSDRGYDYAQTSGYRDPINYVNTQPSWYPSQASPLNYQRSSSASAAPQNFQNSPAHYHGAPPPPSRISPSSSSRGFPSVENSSRYTPTQAASYYGSRASNTSRSSNPPNPPAQALSPSQMQLVRYNDERPVSDYDAPENEQYPAPTSPPWSMETNRGTSVSERSVSDTSSQDMYSEGSGYSDVTRSSGYVESYDVASYGDYRGDNSEDEREYMSDDVASNEGEYDSSGDEPEYGDDGDDVYSDEGYSDSYDDESYDFD